MDLVTHPGGAFTAHGDPGEPTTGARRISVTTEEGELLAMLADWKNVLEIGTGLGISTQALASRAEWVTTIDPDPWVQENVWPELPNHVTPLLERPYPNRTFDLIFIDGDHETEPTIADIDYAHEVCTRGIIVVHDAKMPTVRRALESFGTFGYISTHFGMGIEFWGWDA